MDPTEIGSFYVVLVWFPLPQPTFMMTSTMLNIRCPSKISFLGGVANTSHPSQSLPSSATFSTFVLPAGGDLFVLVHWGPNTWAPWFTIFAASHIIIIIIIMPTVSPFAPEVQEIYLCGSQAPCIPGTELVTWQGKRVVGGHVHGWCGHLIWE